MILIGLSIAWTVIILNIHYHVKDSPVPKWAQSLILRRRPKKRLCCPLLERNDTPESQFVFRPVFPQTETHRNGLFKRKDMAAARPPSPTEFYLTHQTEIDPLPLPASPAPPPPLPTPPPVAMETETVVRLRGACASDAFSTAHDTCGVPSGYHTDDGVPCVGGAPGHSLYVPEPTNNAEDWKVLARTLDKVVFAVIFTLMVFSAVFTLTMPFYKDKTTDSHNNH